MIVLTGVVNKLSRPRDDHGTALANTRRIQKGFEPNRARQKPPTGTTQSIAKNLRRKPPTRHGADSAAPTRRSGSAWRGAPTQLPHARTRRAPELKARTPPLPALACGTRQHKGDLTHAIRRWLSV